MKRAYLFWSLTRYIQSTGQIVTDTMSEAVREAFAAHDLDSDGMLSYKEMATTMRDLAKHAGVSQRIRANAIDEFFTRFDANSDDHVSFEEFAAQHKTFVEWATELAESEKEPDRPLSEAELALGREAAEFNTEGHHVHVGYAHHIAAPTAAPSGLGIEHKVWPTIEPQHAPATSECQVRWSALFALTLYSSMPPSMWSRAVSNLTTWSATA